MLSHKIFKHRKMLYGKEATRLNSVCMTDLSSPALPRIC